MFGVMFLSFNFQMYADSVVLLEYFLFENERLWAYILRLQILSIEPL